MAKSLTDLLGDVEDAARREALQMRKDIGAEIVRDAKRMSGADMVEQLIAPAWIAGLSADELAMFKKGMQFAASLVANPDYDY